MCSDLIVPIRCTFTLHRHTKRTGVFLLVSAGLLLYYTVAAEPYFLMHFPKLHTVLNEYVCVFEQKLISPMCPLYWRVNGAGECESFASKYCFYKHCKISVSRIVSCWLWRIPCQLPLSENFVTLRYYMSRWFKKINELSVVQISGTASKNALDLHFSN